MGQPMRNKLRHFWHEFYYSVFSQGGEEFALTCKQAVEHIELKNDSRSWRTWFRLRLHLSLCEMCSVYFRTSRALGKIVRGLVKKSEKSIHVEKLNQELLEKYTNRKKI